MRHPDHDRDERDSGGGVAATPRADREPRRRREGQRPGPDDRAVAAPTDRNATTRHRVRRCDVIVLINQMAVMLDTGVPLDQTLQSISHRTTDPAFREVLEQVTALVQSGTPLSTALARHPRAFPPIMIALTRASEASGTMGTMFARLATYLTKEYQTIKQVRGALMYPAFMLMMSMSITVVLLALVLPRFAAIYAMRNTILPGPTRVLMGASELLVAHWPLWSIGGAAIASLALLARTTGWGKVQVDWLKLHLPVIGALSNRLYLSRICRTFATMIEAGVPLLEIVGITRAVVGNVYYQRLWDEVDGNIRRGRPLADSLHLSPLFPDHVAQMIESGESTGQLERVFDRVADFAEAEYELALKSATRYIEPVMIMAMGVLIGFVAISLMLPIFQAGRVVAGG